MTRTTRRLAAIGALCLGLAACGDDTGDPTGAKAKTTFTVGVSQIVEHPVLDAVKSGIAERLAELGAKRGAKFDLVVKNAQGEVPNTQTIAQQFTQDGVDMIVAIGTPSVVAAAKVTKDLPIVFGGMTDPVGAGVAKTLHAPGGNVTGTTDYVDPARNLAVIKQVLPGARTVGTLLNESEANSVSWEKAFKAAASAAGLKPVVVGVGGSGDVQSAALSLADRVDALIIGADNTAQAATGTIAKIGLQAKRPVFSVAVDATRQGALIGMGLDNREIGRKTADIVASVLLDRRSPATIPIEGLDDLQISVNDKVVSALGISVPDGVGKTG